MFPETNLDDVTTTLSNSQTDLGISFKFDFEAGDFIIKDGKLVKTEGSSSIQTWIEKQLRTELQKYKIHEDIEYGLTINKLIGKKYPNGFVASEIKREISEKLQEHPLIDGIDNLTANQAETRMKINFSVTLTTGEEIEVSV